MKVPSFLLVILVTASMAPAYTVVLNNGKLVRGELIGEDSRTVQLRDGNGTLLSVGKHLIDTRSTFLANEPFVLPARPLRNQDTGPKSLVEIAEMSRKNRTGNVPVLRDVVYHGSSDISILGTEDESKVVLKIPADDSIIPTRDEQHWRREARSIRNSVRRLRERHISTDSACIRSESKRATVLHTPSRKPVDLLSTMEETSECRLAREVHLQLKDEEYRWEDFEERARKAGVPYSWLE